MIEPEPVRSRVLVVDDEENVLVTMRAILSMDGHDIDTARMGAEAIELIRSREYDLVLTDLRLEDISGQEVLAAVRRESPGTVAVMLTGYASLESAIAAVREGAYDYLVKPSEPEELRATVRRGIERRRLERRVARLQELDEMKSQFLSIASHELRTPITAVSGFAQLALRGIRERLQASPPADPAWAAEVERLVRQLGIIQDQSAKLGRLVRELLDVSRIQSGRLEFQTDRVDMGALARAVTEQVQLGAPERTFRFSGPPDGEAVVTGDRDHLEQAVGNLLDNALKYSPDEGPIDVRVAADGDEARILVEDHGIGIPPDQLGRIFELFYRTEEAETRRTPGLGLGLYITRGIVERHGGRIWAESERGKGTRVHVALPLERARRTVQVEAGGAAART